MSERKIRENFSVGDRVNISDAQGVVCSGTVLNFLSAQFVVKKDDGNCEFFFYSEKPKISLCED